MSSESPIKVPRPKLNIYEELSWRKLLLTLIVVVVVAILLTWIVSLFGSQQPTVTLSLSANTQPPTERIYQTTLVINVGGKDVTRVLYLERTMLAMHLRDGSVMCESASKNDPCLTCSPGTFRSLTTIPMDVPKERAAELRADNAVLPLR